MIVAAPIAGSSNELADWLELDVLCSVTGAAPLAAVNEALEIGEDAEPDALDDENLLQEKRLQQVVSAFDERRKAMEDSYPYQVTPDGLQLCLRDELEPGAWAYLFCLIVSAAAPDGLLDSEPVKPDLKRARELFQVCATLAAAGFRCGPAFSTGWPRPDRSQFLAKLREVYDHFGDAVVVHASPPPGAQARAKDDEIDVIAWQHTTDPGPRVGYFLGQAASGQNWDMKSLKGHVDAFHGTWFLSSPPTPMVGTIMPFCLASPSDAAALEHEEQEHVLAAIRGHNRRHALEHGELLYRHRVARFVAAGLALHARGVGPIERVADLPQVEAYVRAFRAQLRKGCGAT